MNTHLDRILNNKRCKKMRFRGFLKKKAIKIISKKYNLQHRNSYYSVAFFPVENIDENNEEIERLKDYEFIKEVSGCYIFYKVFMAWIDIFKKEFVPEKILMITKMNGRER